MRTTCWASQAPEARQDRTLAVIGRAHAGEQQQLGGHRLRALRHRLRATCPGSNGSPSSATWRGFTSRLRAAVKPSEAHRRRVLEGVPVRLPGRRPVRRGRRARPPAGGGDQPQPPRDKFFGTAAAVGKTFELDEPALPGGGRGAGRAPACASSASRTSGCRSPSRGRGAPAESWAGASRWRCCVDPRHPGGKRRSRSGWAAGSRPTPDQFRRMQAARTPCSEHRPDIFGDDLDRPTGAASWALLGPSRCFHAAAGGEPDQPQPEPHPGARLGDRGAQGLRGHRRARWSGSSSSRTWC